jgi:hypothetical protein
MVEEEAPGLVIARNEAGEHYLRLDRLSAPKFQPPGSATQLFHRLREPHAVRAFKLAQNG